ncbi:hypothetical protein ACNKHU_14075 [Shigella flexneri]
MDGAPLPSAKYIGATPPPWTSSGCRGFTGGIGELRPDFRALPVQAGLLGFDVDHDANLKARFGKSGFINKEGTRPAVVIPTNEELVIAQDASRLTA